VGETGIDLGRLVAWPAATIIAVTILVNELLPFLHGTGERAVFDWGFFYVTFRFILLPLACGAHVIVNTGVLVFSRRNPLGKRLLRFGSVVVSFAFLAISYFYPLPLFKGLL